jgi:hypothetical protein
MESKRITSSFRDPSGYVFMDENSVKRTINPIYFPQYTALNQSGFYTKLFDKKLLISHKESFKSDKQIIIEPIKIPFVSYPYEWSFLQYKHAALLTLKIQKYSLEHNFTLKDASAFNITFHEGKPIFIDSLSFDFYIENTPWHAYKQFIMHFLGPLVLGSYYGLDYLKILSYDIEGMSIEKLSKLLPTRSYLNPIILTNIHLLAKFEKKYASDKKSGKQNLSKASQIKLLESIYDFIKNLKVKQNTEWDNYYNQTNYNDDSIALKKELTNKWFTSINGKTLIDIGGNDGTFSRQLMQQASLMIVADVDANAVEQNYKQTITNQEKTIVPIVIDILNPPANYGFNNQERFSFIDRVIDIKLDGCLALAVIHHITLTGNIPFQLSAQFFAKMANNLLVEFPTRDDSWVQFLLESKRDFASHFDFYNEENFENDYLVYYELIEKVSIPNTHRVLYSLKLRNK